MARAIPCLPTGLAKRERIPAPRGCPETDLTVGWRRKEGIQMSEAGFAERLKRYRREKGMTQQELADELGVSNKTISRWESGGGTPT